MSGSTSIVDGARRSTDASSSRRSIVHRRLLSAPAGGASRTNGKHHRPIARTGSVAVSLRRSVIFCSFLAHGIRHCCAALPKRFSWPVVESCAF